MRLIKVVLQLTSSNIFSRWSEFITSRYWNKRKTNIIYTCIIT